MKTIQWYPGHMAKAVRMMEENLNLCDAIVFVLDARAPAASYNPRLSLMAKNKPALYLFNKSDLADEKAETLASAVKRSGKNVLLFSASSAQIRPLQAAMRAVARERAEKLAQKGSSRPLRFLVAGIPNTGKSTVINLLSGGKKAQTGDKAGVTRTKQWVKCDGFDLLDTPGAMPPSCENQKLAVRLACLGSINDDILEMDEIALALLGELSKQYPENLSGRYGIEGGTPLEMLERVCARRGFVLKGGDYDYERGERALIDDFRKGKLGRMCLDGEEDLKEVGLI